MTITPEQIRQWVADIQEESISIRRYLHAHPEVSFEEYETTRYLTSLLDEWKIPYTLNPAGCGLIGRLDPTTELTADSPVLAFRADIDALAIQEETGCDFASVNSGKMHACGHDIHMTILLGLAHILAEHRDQLTHPVRFIFQPAEENYPGGADAMIKTGLLEDVDFYYGLHVAPDLPVGTIGVRPGPTMATPTTFHITIEGRSGHGATPQEAVDPVVTASHLVLALQSIVSRNVSPFDTAVLSVCHIESGTTHNVIPQYAKLTGTVRTFSEEVLVQIEARMRTICDSICHAMGAACELILDRGYPVVDNQPGPTQLIENAARFMGHHVYAKAPAMIGEDFAYYINHRTGCFFHLGTASDASGSQAGLHNSRHMPDEAAIAVGIETMLAAYFLTH